MMMRTRLLLPATIALSILIAAGDATAQGFPGGGGGGGRGMGGRGMRSHEETSPAQKPVQNAQNPLVVFLAGLRSLRMDLLVRTEQLDAWTAMQDALVTVAEAERDASAARPVSSDPSVRLRSFAEDLSRRAEATKAATDHIGAVFAVLDDHQKQIFLARLSDAFAGGSGPQ